MIVRLNVDGYEALTTMDILRRNGFNPVMTVVESEDGKTPNFPYLISFDTDGQLVKGGDICMGDCVNCPLCNETCEEWEDCEHGAIMHTTPDKELETEPEKCEEEGEPRIVVLPFGELCDMIYNVLTDSIEDTAKSNSRILNE